MILLLFLDFLHKRVRHTRRSSNEKHSKIGAHCQEGENDVPMSTIAKPRKGGFTVTVLNHGQEIIFEPVNVISRRNIFMCVTIVRGDKGCKLHVIGRTSLLISEAVVFIEADAHGLDGRDERRGTDVAPRAETEVTSCGVCVNTDSSCLSAALRVGVRSRFVVIALNVVPETWASVAELCEKFVTFDTITQIPDVTRKGIVDRVDEIQTSSDRDNDDECSADATVDDRICPKVVSTNTIVAAPKRIGKTNCEKDQVDLNAGLHQQTPNHRTPFATVHTIIQRLGRAARWRWRFLLR